MFCSQNANSFQPFLSISACVNSNLLHFFFPITEKPAVEDTEECDKKRLLQKKKQHICCPKIIVYRESVIMTDKTDWPLSPPSLQVCLNMLLSDEQFRAEISFPVLGLVLSCDVDQISAEEKNIASLNLISRLFLRFGRFHSSFGLSPNSMFSNTITNFQYSAIHVQSPFLMHHPCYF